MSLSLPTLSGYGNTFVDERKEKLANIQFVYTFQSR